MPWGIIRFEISAALGTLAELKASGTFEQIKGYRSSGPFPFGATALKKASICNSLHGKLGACLTDVLAREKHITLINCLISQSPPITS